jgi:hypothetical protein
VRSPRPAGSRSGYRLLACPARSGRRPRTRPGGEPVPTTTGVNKGTPEAATRSISAKETVMARAWRPATERGAASRNELLQGAQRGVERVLQGRVLGYHEQRRDHMKSV